MCTQVLDGLVAALREVDLEVGRDFDVLTVTIDPEETAELARAKRESCLEAYARPVAGEGWRFLTAAPGAEQAVERLAASVGFRYLYVPERDEYAHASGVVVLTPEGRVARYFFGIEYPPRDLRLALVEASRGRIGTLADQLLLLCYHWDPTTGRYGLVILGVTRILGLATVGGLAAWLFLALRRERRGERLSAGRV
jgi:protein SCO1/2